MLLENKKQPIYYKRRQAEKIMRALNFDFFGLGSDEFWDFIVAVEGKLKLVKMARPEDEIVIPEGKEHTNFEREIWRFPYQAKMPVIEKIK